MAEYIIREEVFELKQDYGEGQYSMMLIDPALVKRLPTADVIERSKVDKAIEKLRKEIEENRLNVIDYADGEWIVKDFVYGAIDRLKEKITLDKQ